MLLPFWAVWLHPGLVSAASIGEDQHQTDNVSSLEDLNNLSDRNFLKLVGGFTDSDLDQLSSSDIADISKSAKAEMNNPYKTEVGYSSVAKAVLKAWKKLPSGVKKKIAKYTGIGGLLKAIDHFTGTEEHIIYSALRECGVPANYAHIATKVITLFI